MTSETLLSFTHLGSPVARLHSTDPCDHVQPMALIGGGAPGVSVCVSRNGVLCELWPKRPSF